MRTIRLSRRMDIILPSRRVVFSGVTPDDADVDDLKTFDPTATVECMMVRVPFRYWLWIRMALLFMDREDVEAMIADRLYKAIRWC